MTERDYMLCELLFGVRNAIAVLPRTTVDEFEAELLDIERALAELRLRVEPLVSEET